MTRDHYRTIGALLGLAVGVVCMIWLGYRGVVPSAMFGAGGCVLGGTLGESMHAKWHASSTRDSNSHDSTINKPS